MFKTFEFKLPSEQVAAIADDPRQENLKYN